MSYRLKSITKPAERQSILTTLAIAAMIHQTNEAVQETAKHLMRDASISLVKSLLKPLSESHNALDIVIDEVVYPIEEKILGRVTLDNYTYDIVITWRGILDYTTDQIALLTAGRFIQRGLIVGRIYMTMIHPVYRHEYSTSLDLAEVSRFSRADIEHAA